MSAGIPTAAIWQEPEWIQRLFSILWGHSDIGVTMNTYTHLGLDAAKEEMIRLEELNQDQAKKEINKTEGKKPLKQNMFRVI